MRSTFAPKLLLSDPTYLSLSVKYILSFSQGKNSDVDIKCFPIACRHPFVLFQKDIFYVQNFYLKVWKGGGQS